MRARGLKKFVLAIVKGWWCKTFEAIPPHNMRRRGRREVMKPNDWFLMSDGTWAKITGLWVGMTPDFVLDRHPPFWDGNAKVVSVWEIIS